jgi:hypothetical protein
MAFWDSFGAGSHGFTAKRNKTKEEQNFLEYMVKSMKKGKIDPIDVITAEVMIAAGQFEEAKSKWWSGLEWAIQRAGEDDE